VALGVTEPFASAEAVDQAAYEAAQAGGQLRPFPTVDLAEIAKAGVPAPTLLFNDLLYRGMLHSLAGPPDCGKTTIAYRAALERLAMDEHVVVLDEEGGREVVAEKFLALGAEPAHLERLHYVEFPGRSWDEADRAGLWELLGRVKPTLVIVDSAGAFLGAAGQDENWAAHVTPFYKLLLAAARDHNTAVLVLDHVTKNENTGRYARGSGAKLQVADVALMVDAIRPFNRHQSGLLKLSVSKDRRGYLHRRFEVRVDVEDGTMALTFDRVEAEEGDPELAGLPPAAVKILTVLRAAAGPMAVREIVDGVADRFGHGLKRPTVSRSLNTLADRALVDGEGESGKEKCWWALPRNP
jgi:hypothetical protein